MLVLAWGQPLAEIQAMQIRRFRKEDGENLQNGVVRFCDKLQI